MKPKINEITASYIECGECGYEKSCLFPENMKQGSFSWHCPQCNQLWAGGVDKEREVSIEKSGGSTEPRHILINLPGEYSPLALMVSRMETPGESAERSGGQTGKAAAAVISDTLVLEPARTSAESNPNGFPQYRAGIF